MVTQISIYYLFILLTYSNGISPFFPTTYFFISLKYMSSKQAMLTLNSKADKKKIFAGYRWIDYIETGAVLAVS